MPSQCGCGLQVLAQHHLRYQSKNSIGFHWHSFVKHSSDSNSMFSKKSLEDEVDPQAKSNSVKFYDDRHLEEASKAYSNWW